MLNIALPKGRLADKTCKLLTSLGVISAAETDNRKLVFEDKEAGVRYFMVKPSDVAIYVEYGVADIGVVGKDVLLESSPDVYELLDLKMGKCKMCVAGKDDFFEDTGRPLRVATKFVNIALNYYAGLGREIEVIKLHGSIELAPLLGISDVIVDLVETGATLRENNLKVLSDIMPVSARLICNKTSFKFKFDTINTLVERLKEVIK